jgi:hypothetical protein
MNLILCNRWGKFPLEKPPRSFAIIFEVVFASVSQRLDD